MVQFGHSGSILIGVIHYMRAHGEADLNKMEMQQRDVVTRCSGEKTKAEG